MSELYTIFSESALLLEKALHEKENHKYDVDLQLQGSVCGLATAALQLYMREMHDMDLDRRIVTPRKAPRGLNSRALQHVSLFQGGQMIDPSYRQFFTYVGLSQDAAKAQPALKGLFPSDKIAVIRADKAGSFADRMAVHMHTIESEVARRRPVGLPSYPPENSLVGTTLGEKEEVLRDIWNPTSYSIPFPLEDQSSSFRQRALQLAVRMHELE